MYVLTSGNVMSSRRMYTHESVESGLAKSVTSFRCISQKFIRLLKQTDLHSVRILHSNTHCSSERPVKGRNSRFESRRVDHLVTLKFSDALVTKTLSQNVEKAIMVKFILDKIQQSFISTIF